MILISTLTLLFCCSWECMTTTISLLRIPYSCPCWDRAGLIFSVNFNMNSSANSSLQKARLRSRLVSGSGPFATLQLCNKCFAVLAIAALHHFLLLSTDCTHRADHKVMPDLLHAQLRHKPGLGQDHGREKTRSNEGCCSSKYVHSRIMENE